jgi:hypothetical protein
MKYPTLLGISCCVLLSVIGVAEEARPEEKYGRALASRKIPGIGPCMAVEVVGKRLFAIGQGDLHAFDITKPDAPKPLGHISGLGNTRQIAVRNGIAYVTARQDGLWLIDVSDAARPAIISHYDTVEMATGIRVSGTVAFVATRCYGVEVVDVSNPQEPRHVTTLKTGEAQSCWGRDGLLYIGDWAPRKLLVADVRNPREPVIVGEAPLDGFGDGGCLRGNLCFAATGHHSRAAAKEAGFGKGHGLEIYDVAKPREPALVSRIKFPASYHISNDMWTARISGSHCVVADTWNGLFVVDVSDASRPAIVAHAVLPLAPKSKDPDPVGGIALGDGVIYAAGIYTGLYVVSAPGMAETVEAEADEALEIPPIGGAPPSDPDFLVYQPRGQVRSVTLVGDIAWTACGAAGIQSVHLGETLEPVGITPGRAEVFHVAVSGDRLYAAESGGGLGIYQIGPRQVLTEIGRLKLAGQNVKQVACPPPGRFALFHCGSAQIQIADVSDPTRPRIVFRDSQVGLFYGDQLVPELIGGRFLVAHWQRSGPAWYDVAGVVPTLLGNSPDERLYSWTDGACAFDGKLLIVKAGKLQLLEPGDMREVSRLPAFGIEGNRLSGRPSTKGTMLALARRHEKMVQLLDITDIEHPKMKRGYTLRGHPGACAFWNGRVVIPAGYQGLLLERREPKVHPGE